LAKLIEIWEEASTKMYGRFCLKFPQNKMTGE